MDKMHFLDMDLYKLVNQCAIHRHFPDAEATWKFTNRSPNFLVTEVAFGSIKSQIEGLKDVVITGAELDFLRKECPYFSEEYLEYLASFRYRVENLTITFQPIAPYELNPDGEGLGSIEVGAQGNWCETTLFESPVLQILAEAFHRYVLPYTGDYSGQEETAYNKASLFIRSGIRFAQFGSRRRRSLYGQEIVTRALQRAQLDTGQDESSRCFLGSTNVHLCRILGLKPLSTMSHEWFMGVGAILGDYSRVTVNGLSLWVDCFGPWLKQGHMFGLALPDTFGSNFFLQDFDGIYTTKNQNSRLDKVPFTSIFAGLRQDSGDAEQFISLAREFYSSISLTNRDHVSVDDHSDQPLLMFSDSLTLAKSRNLAGIAQEAGFRTCFGLGSAFTNDFPDRHRHPNIVFKLVAIDDKMAVKISDVPGKGHGDANTRAKILEQQITMRF